ncbi:MAG: PstS family phosphate ABC transporter substrate-binding protein [Pirellulales bacterium]|nr:PstS family phosphate ABC transporter substrate-binding protein [Pirellulales bacterium]
MHLFYRILTLCLILTACCWLVPTGDLAAAENAVQTPPGALDPNLPFYRPIEALNGELQLGGSNTLSHVATVWIDGFKQFYPDVKISIDVNGSRKAVNDVSAGKTHIGLLSRTIYREEVDAFRKKHGYNPTVLTPCLERTAIFVHKDNPIPGLTIPQVDAIFSNECRRGGEKYCGTWKQFGLQESWAGEPIVVHGRTKDTGSQVFMQQAVLLGSPFRGDLQTHRSNVEMLQAIAKDPSSIGFSGLSYATSGVRAVPLAFAEGEAFVAIDSEKAARGHYPLVRQLQFVVKHNPQEQLPPVQQEFIKYVFSRLGQEGVVKAGFQAIPARPARIALDAVGLGISR